MISAKDYFNKGNGKALIRAIELNDVNSIYSMMEDFADDSKTPETKMDTIPKIKEILKEEFKHYKGFIDHTLVAKMAFRYHQIAMSKKK